MNQRGVNYHKPPSSVKNTSFFPTKPFSPQKTDLYQYYMSENPTPSNQARKQLSRDFTQMPQSNLISINNGVHNQVYYIQPPSLAQGRQNSYDISHISSGGETLDQIWTRAGLCNPPSTSTNQQQLRKKKQNSSFHGSNNSSKIIQVEDTKKRSKAQNMLFTMLMNDQNNKSNAINTDGNRKGSKNNIQINNLTTPHSMQNRKNSHSLQKRLEDTYQIKTTKTSKNNKTNNFSMQGTNWYMPKQRDSSAKPLDKIQNQSFNQTLPYSKNSIKNNLNYSQEGQNTGEISFENNVLQRGIQAEYMNLLQYQSDNSKPEIKAEDNLSQHNEYQKYNPKAVQLLENAKENLKNKNNNVAIEQLKESITIDQNLLDGHYFLGVTYLGSLQYSKAVQEFQSLLKQNPLHRRNVYLFLAIAYKKINEIEKSIKILTNALNVFPKYYDALIYRGKLYIKTKQLEKALADFQSAINISPKKGFGYLGKADCQRYNGNLRDAIHTYQKAIQNDSTIKNAALLKKAIVLFELKDYTESINVLNLLLESDQINSEAYYFKGLSNLYSKNAQDALLCFEQSIKHNNSKKAVTKSLYEIAKIKIDQRDFYAAYHTLNRAEFLDTERTYLEKFRLFTEAVIFLMKRKFSESIQNFQTIQQKHSLNDFLKPLYYAYRAYGYFCQSQHQKALSDYKQLQEVLGHLDQGSNYNQLLCEGIIHSMSGFHDRGMEYFTQASKLFPKKMEPLFYNGITLIHKAFHSKSQNIKDKISLVLKGLEIIEKASHLNEQNANILYIKGIIKSFLQSFGDALQEIEKAIEKSEDNIPKYFYLRGLIYGLTKQSYNQLVFTRQYKAAVSDLTICINLDENFSNAYLQRAKCQFLLGETTQAFADLQTYISLQPEDPQIHIWAGNFLFANGAIEDAVKAYSHSPDFQKNEQLLLYRASCYVVMGQLKNCLIDIDSLYAITKDIKFEFDREFIKALIIVFRNAEEIYFDDENESELYEIQKRISQSLHLITQLSQNKVQGKLFFKHHIYLFRGVYNFHLKKYEEALKDWQIARSQKELQITEKRLTRQRNDLQKSLTDLFQNINSIEQSNEITEEEEDADLLELLEIRFNELVCLTVLKQYKKAKEKCRQLMENINENKQEGLQHLIVLIDREIRKQDGKTYNNIDQEFDKVVCLYDEPKENPICFQVPLITINSLNDLKIRLSFSLPKINPPSLIPIFEKNILTELSPLSVENKPEAPWIRRNENQGDMIMFTDNIQMLDDIRLETEVEQDDKKKDDQQKNLDKDVFYEEQAVDFSTMKQNLLLDRDVEEKLKRILERKSKNCQN